MLRLSVPEQHRVTQFSLKFDERKDSEFISTEELDLFVCFAVIVQIEKKDRRNKYVFRIYRRTRNDAKNGA